MKFRHNFIFVVFSVFAFVGCAPHPNSGAFVSGDGQMIILSDDGHITWSTSGAIGGASVYLGVAPSPVPDEYAYITMPSAHVNLGTRIRRLEGDSGIEVEWVFLVSKPANQRATRYASQ